MARYPIGSRERRRNRPRNQIYIILALLIVAVVVAFIYGPRPFGGNKNRDEIYKDINDTNVPEVNETLPPAPKLEVEPNVSEVAPKPTVSVPKVVELIDDSNPEAAKLIAEAMEFISGKPAKIIDARVRLSEVLPMPMSDQQRAFVKDQLSVLADKWLFSRTIFPQDRLSGSYKVKTGDQLRTIGKQFKIPWEILKDINNIPRAQALRAGDMIKVINGPFHARVYRSTFTMDLYLQDTFVRSFPVGLGKSGRETPTGLWRVKPGGKLIEPPWPDPDTGKILHAGDPNYALGSRWIGLEGVRGQAKDRTGFGIHGTKEPETIGTASSRGCIRLHNGDAILVYNLLVPGLSLVEVVE